MSETIKLYWHVSTKELLDEILSNREMWMCELPVKIMYNIMREVSQRAIELNDFKLNVLMIRLGLYSIADPTHKDYNSELAVKLMNTETETEFNKLMKAQKT